MAFKFNPITCNLDLIGGGGGGGDFMADGSVPMTGNLDLGTNDIINGGEISAEGLKATGATFNDSTTGVEIGVVGGAGFSQAFNRGALAFIPMQFVGSTLDFRTSTGGDVQVTAFTVGTDQISDWQTNRLTNAGDPADPQDVATKAYVDSVSGGFVEQNQLNLGLNANSLVREKTETASEWIYIGGEDVLTGDTTTAPDSLFIATGVVEDPTATANCGDIIMTPGYNYGTGNGGHITIYGGDCEGVGATPGNVAIGSGANYDDNTGGNVRLYAGGTGAGKGMIEVENLTPFRFGHFTAAQRDALTAVNGMVIYNSDTDKLQVRAAGAWVDLH